MEISQEILDNAREIYAGLNVENLKPYRPSNGSEGMMFEAIWCDKCTGESVIKSCDIFCSALFGATPKEWMYYNNAPICTAFKKRE